MSFLAASAKGPSDSSSAEQCRNGGLFRVWGFGKQSNTKGRGESDLWSYREITRVPRRERGFLGPVIMTRHFLS